LMVVIDAKDILQPATLSRLKKISKAMERLKDLDSIMSLFTLKDIKGEDGQMLVDPMVKRIPKSLAAREKLRQRIKENDLVYESVISTDFKTSIIIGMVKNTAQDAGLVSSIKQIVSDHPGPEAVHLAGLPFIRENISKNIRGDLQRFLPFGLLIMLIFLFVAFRQLRGVVLPFLVVVMAILFTMGMIPFLGWKLQMIMVILPVIMVAVANDYGIHLMARYQEENFPGCHLDKKELSRRVFKALSGPVFFAGITTMAGLLCLLSHIIVPAQKMGVLAAVGIAYALLASILFIPAVLSIMPRAKPLASMDPQAIKKPLLERLLFRIVNMVGNHPKKVLHFSVIITILLASGTYFLEVDTNPIHYYPPDHPLVKSSLLVNDKFGGITVLSIIAKDDIKAPKVLRQLDLLEKKLSSHPYIGQSVSIAKVVRRMNRVMHDNHPEKDRLPDNRKAVAQYFLLYSMSGEPEDFERLVDFDYKHANVTARINTLSTGKISETVKYVNDYVNGLPESPFVLTGGFAEVLAELDREIVAGQVKSLLLSLLAVSLLVMLLFRSVSAGFITILPLGLAISILFGLMGILQIPLNIATAMLSSIMIGVGVDYTIHFLWRYRIERRQHPAVQAVAITLTTTGRGIVFNALSVIIGFSVLMLSSFMPVQFFGFLVLVSISICLLGAMVVLPALVLLVKPSFLEP